MNLFLGADVDTLRRFGQHEDLGTLDQLPGQHHLLGIATGHRTDELLLAGSLHGEPGDQVLCDGAFPTTIHPATEFRQQRKVAGRDVERDGLEGEHALQLPICGQQRDTQLLRLPWRSRCDRLAAQEDLSGGRPIHSIDGCRDLGDAGADKAVERYDLARPDRDIHRVELAGDTQVL